jgi:outer membrane lipoprotein carrier protein
MLQCMPCLLYLILAAMGSPDVKAAVTRLESRYHSAKTLRASFLERYSENGRLVRVEAGVAYFRRPGKMRWEYESPEKNLFLVDGKSAWFYVPADHTVTRVPAKESADWRTPFALLAGEMKVSRICAKVDAAPDEKPEASDDIVLHCELRGAPPAKQGNQNATSLPTNPGEAVFFEVARNSGELVRVLVQDPGGLRIEFHFRDWQSDPPVADALFHFTVPSGVAIVNGVLPADKTSVNQ